MLNAGEEARIRELAARVRDLKAAHYATMTWNVAMTQVARESSLSDSDYYRTLALFGYFLDEERSRALCSLNVFLEGLDDAVRNLRERDRGYALTPDECASAREQIDAYLRRVGKPTDPGTAFDYYQVQKDKVFVSHSLAQLLSSLDDLASTLRRWYPAGYSEVVMLAEHAPLLLKFASIATTPTTLRVASSTGSNDFSPLRDVLHRFVLIDVFSKQRAGRENAYAFKSSRIDTNRLRREWQWLWSQPGARLSFWIYEGDRDRKMPSTDLPRLG